MRVAGAVALGYLGAEAKAALPLLVAALRDVDAFVRRAAVSASARAKRRRHVRWL